MHRNTCHKLRPAAMTQAGSENTHLTPQTALVGERTRVESRDLLAFPEVGWADVGTWLCACTSIDNIATKLYYLWYKVRASVSSLPDLVTQ